MQHIKDLIARVARAKRDAYETAPRDSNEHLDAAMFVAMAHAYNDWHEEKATEPETLAPQVVGALPPPVTEDELGPNYD